jgi:hypothetical protein
LIDVAWVTQFSPSFSPSHLRQASIFAALRRDKSAWEASGRLIDIGTISFDSIGCRLERNVARDLPSLGFGMAGELEIIKRQPVRGGGSALI